MATLMPGVYCTFRVGTLLVGIDVERVQEVLHGAEITPVPMADPSVLGLLNLRGQIVTAIDGRRRMGVTDRGPEESSAHVIVRCQAEAVSLVVDSEDEVVDVSTQTADEVPETLSSSIRELVVGIQQMDSDLLLVLDPDRTLLLTATRTGGER